MIMIIPSFLAPGLDGMDGCGRMSDMMDVNIHQPIMEGRACRHTRGSDHPFLSSVANYLSSYGWSFKGKEEAGVGMGMGMGMGMVSVVVLTITNFLLNRRPLTRVLLIFFSFLFHVQTINISSSAASVPISSPPFFSLPLSRSISSYPPPFLGYLFIFG